MKKIFTVLSLLLAICVCSTGITANAYATSVDEPALGEAYICEVLSDLSRMSNGRVFEIESASFLKGFSGENEYILLTFKPLGYAIISIQTQRIVEASTTLSWDELTAFPKTPFFTSFARQQA